MLRSRSAVRTLVLLAVTVAGLLLIPAGPAQAAQYANCTNLIDSDLHWQQSSCIWNQGGIIYGNSGVAFLSGFNREGVALCGMYLEVWDNTIGSYYGTYRFDCVAAALNGGQWVPPNPYRWFPNNGHSWRQYAYMIVDTWSGGHYDSRTTTCALRYYPQGIGQAGC